MVVDILGQSYGWVALGVIVVVAAKLRRMAVTAAVIVLAATVAHFDLLPLPGLPWPEAP